MYSCRSYSFLLKFDRLPADLIFIHFFKDEIERERERAIQEGTQVCQSKETEVAAGSCVLAQTSYTIDDRTNATCVRTDRTKTLTAHSSHI